MKILKNILVISLLISGYCNVYGKCCGGKKEHTEANKQQTTSTKKTKPGKGNSITGGGFSKPAYPEVGVSGGSRGSSSEDEEKRCLKCSEVLLQYSSGQYCSECQCSANYCLTN